MAMKTKTKQQSEDEMLLDMPIPSVEEEKMVVKKEEEPFILTQEHKTALKLISEGHRAVFLSGKAGTGKSRFLKEVLMKEPQQTVVLSPTGIAAINVGGQTIHSFLKINPFEFDFNNYHFDSRLQDILYSVDRIIIDEISMVSGFLLDAVDFRLRQHAPNMEESNLHFGGKQVIMIGDPYQLPPVIGGNKKIEDFFTELYGKPNPYFFEALVFRDEEHPLELKKVEFTKVFRQKDPIFLSVLNAIREGKATQGDLDVINLRVNHTQEKCITLVTTNATADSMNNAELKKIDAQSHYLSAEVNGNFSKNDCPAAEEIEIRVGARIMMLKNNHPHWQNGTLGTVKDIISGRFVEPTVIVELDNGEVHEVGQFTWEKYEYDVNPKTKRLEKNRIGSFMQVPIKLAFAITIHKSQGQTFDNVHIDMGYGAFAYGQTYVALSRCKSLEGITLKKKIGLKDIFVDKDIAGFMNSIPSVVYEEDQNEIEIEKLRAEILERQKRILALGGQL